MNIEKLTDPQKARLVENRWASSETVWDIVTKTYTTNVKTYKNEPEWLAALPRKHPRVRANRIFVNTEAVINSVIANPPKPNIVPGRDSDESKKLARLQEKYFIRRYDDRNVKETLRKGLRNLYFSRLIVLKPFWDSKLNDFNVRAIDPRKVRFGKNATKEDDSEFAIEEVTDSLSSVLARFPGKKDDVLRLMGYTDEAEILIENPDVTYKEAWIRDYVIFKLQNVILGCVRNPYWDWDGLLVTPQEEEELKELGGEPRRDRLFDIRMQQDGRKEALQARMPQQEALQAPEAQPLRPIEAGLPQMEQAMPPQAPDDMSEQAMPVQQTPAQSPEEEELRAYFFNHFNEPRKPYIFATLFNNENSPVGQTDMITQAIPLQENVDETKRDITRNARFVNGIMVIDSEVMSKAEAQRLDTETSGKIWGKGAPTGVIRVTGEPLPNFVIENMQDSRSEIDNIMAASSAFRGEREGTETKAGRLALIDQSYLRLNELVQVVDYAYSELFNWFYQLAKVRYTERHWAKELGKDAAMEIIELIQDDFEDGTEVRVIGGKTLPEDRQFKYEQAQADVEKGILSPVDYFEVAGYNEPSQKAKNMVMYRLNEPLAVGMSEQELQQYQPQQEPDMPSRSISFKDLPVDGQVQLAEQAGIKLDPQIMFAEKVQQHQQQQQEAQLKQQQAAAKSQPQQPKPK